MIRKFGLNRGGGLDWTGMEAAALGRIADIKALCADHYGVPPAIFASRRRTDHISQARQVAMYLSRHLIPDASFPLIALSFGRDHSTIIHGCRQIELQIRDRMGFSGEIAILEAQLLSKWSARERAA